MTPLKHACSRAIYATSASRPCQPPNAPQYQILKDKTFLVTLLVAILMRPIDIERPFVLLIISQNINRKRPFSAFRKPRHALFFTRILMGQGPLPRPRNAHGAFRFGVFRAFHKMHPRLHFCKAEHALGKLKGVLAPRESTKKKHLLAMPIEPLCSKFGVRQNGPTQRSWFARDPLGMLSARAALQKRSRECIHVVNTNPDSHTSIHYLLFT